MGSGWKVSRGRERFEEEPVNRFIRVGQRGQVDLAIPAREEFVVLGKCSDEVVRREEASSGGAPDETGLEISGRHKRRLSKLTSLPCTIDVRADNRDRCWRDARDPEGLAQRGWPDFRQPLHHLVR